MPEPICLLLISIVAPAAMLVAAVIATSLVDAEPAR